MADTITLNAGSGGATLGTDEVTIGGTLQHVQRVKLVDGADGGTALIGGDASNGLDVDVTRVQGSVTVVGAAADGATLSGNPVLVAGSDGTSAQSISVTAGGLVQVHDGGGALSVDDGAGSLTVDAPVGTPVFVRLSDGAAAISALPVTDNGGTLSVDDGGGSLTVDGTVSVSGTVTVDSELTTADLDTGGGTDTRAVVGLVLAASGGGVLAGAANPVPISDNGASLTVDNGGTFAVQAAQSGTWNVTNVSGTVSLPTGAATAAKQPSLGTAGTASADVLTVQGVASMTPLQVADNGGSLTVDGTVAISGTVAVNDNASSLTVDNGGTFAVQESGAALTALQLIDNAIVVDDAAFTPGSTSVSMAGFEADETSTDSVNEGDAGAARMTLDRKLIVTPQPHTTGGLLIHKNLDVDENEDEIKATAGQVYGWYFANRATSVRYIKFYNATAATVSVGTTTPVLTIPIPGNADDVIAANALGGLGIAFDTAICIAATTGFADNDTGAPGANDVLAMVFYT